MARRIYTPERIINKLREAEVLLSQGSTVGDAVRKIGVTEFLINVKQLSELIGLGVFAIYSWIS